ncbi:hypothetical protein HHL22_00970 [Hymenobacter sp. RP-2-7]|uniref:Uncharacterized protein n=1 Tax=Hymenobacter polaris TaxID=2682546 RepID=A0A7Y0AAJ6_9BACT|nr:hypothetical protein [Hymenobacter polaris]NML63768.1 hypothetical protein [Hymenobacter polaris]
MPRPARLTYGLYAWLPAHGYRYVHPANRRSFELLEPVGKVFEKISPDDDSADWITLRYDEQQFLVSPELFKELYEKPAFSFGDLVREARPANGRPPHQGLVSDVFWNEATSRASYQLVERKRKLPQVFAETELQLAG